VAYVTKIDRQSENPKYLEIGVWGGGTIKTLLNFTRHMQFTGVDLFEDFEVAADNTHTSDTFSREDVQAFLGDRAHLLKGDSAIVLPTLADSFDFIFIDGNHTYNATMTDFQQAQRLLRSGGYVAFHNASAHFNPDFAYVTHDGGPWLVTEQIKLGSQWQLVADVDRLRIFSATT
jgi:predicted O-methyltransferase YrrM